MNSQTDWHKCLRIRASVLPTAFALVVALCGGCAGPTPSVSDPEVEKLIADVAKDVLAEVIGKRITLNQAVHRGPRAAELAMQGNMDVGELLARHVQGTIESMRVLEENQSIGLTRFAAEYRISEDVAVPIRGTVQYTEDGGVFVELEYAEEITELAYIDPVIRVLAEKHDLEQQRLSFACDSEDVKAAIRNQVVLHLLESKQLSRAAVNLIAVDVKGITDTGERQGSSYLCTGTLVIDARHARLFSPDLKDSQQEIAYLAELLEDGTVDIVMD